MRSTDLRAAGPGGSHPLAHPGAHEIRAQEVAGPRMCKRCRTRRQSGGHRRLCLSCDDMYVGLFSEHTRDAGENA